MIKKLISTSSQSSLVQKTIHLVDELRKAKITASDRNYVGIHQVTIRRDNRSSIFQHPPSKIEFQAIQLEHNPKLRFACGIKQRIWPKLRNAIVFEVFIKTGVGRPRQLFRKELAPGQRPEDQVWFEQELDLASFSHKKINLIFVTSIPKGAGTQYCWSAWGSPQITHDCTPAQRRSKHPTPAHVILITSDALRPDYLGAYGNTAMHTPNCDGLAKEGMLFSHARVPTVSTLGSYASLLLSQSPLTHLITTEWGAIPKDLPTLPQYLHSHGYHTVLVPSEMELTDPKVGLTSLFEEHTPCLGNPVQDGSITTRLVFDMLERQTKPTFFWIQYFDTHPPVTPPQPFRSMYYSGDPVDEINRDRPEAVAKIRGTEVVQELLVAGPSLAQGEPDAFIIAKFEATAAALRGNEGSDPDFAIHLKSLGPKSHKNMSSVQFASWLDEQVHQLKNGIFSKPLSDWLKEIMPMLQEINDDITTWLDDVVDFRYPLSQYSGAVSYLDSHVGSLLTYLKENKIFDQSLIILTSPHGEILDEQGIYFHHHTLTESCVRIPMIIKPPKNGQSFNAGTKIDGIFDSLDLFPTIADLLGLPVPQGLAGHSRSSHLYNGSPIPEHDSFAIGNSHTMASITRGYYKFIKVAKDHMNSPEWRWRRGDRILFDIREVPSDTGNLVDNLPDVAGEMEQSLDQWLRY